MQKSSISSSDDVYSELIPSLSLSLSPSLSLSLSLSGRFYYITANFVNGVATSFLYDKFRLCFHICFTLTYKMMGPSLNRRPLSALQRYLIKKKSQSGGGGQPQLQYCNASIPGITNEKEILPWKRIETKFSNNTTEDLRTAKEKSKVIISPNTMVLVASSMLGNPDKKQLLIKQRIQYRHHRGKQTYSGRV